MSLSDNFFVVYEETIDLPALRGHTVAVSQSKVSLHILAAHHLNLKDTWNADFV